MNTLKKWQEYGVDFSRPIIMGIVNVTPDSFSDGGKFITPDKAVFHALQLVEDGADIIDVGGESSRPGSVPVTVEEELKRVLPVISGIRKNSNILISIDSTKARVAAKALREGANWINDISGLRFDQEMVKIAQKWDCPVVVMHMKGAPKTMQDDPTYQDVLMELNGFFEERIRFLNEHGVNKLILDPGIGFGKRLEDNLELLRNIDQFKKFSLPLLIGTSRKSFIEKLTGRKIEHRLAGTLASEIWSVLKGVQIIRTHDVVQTKDSLTIIKAIMPNVN